MRFGGVAEAASGPAAAEDDHDFKRRHDGPRREDVAHRVGVREFEARYVYGLRSAVEDFDELILRRAARAVAVGVADQVGGGAARRVGEIFVDDQRIADEDSERHRIRHAEVRVHHDDCQQPCGLGKLRRQERRQPLVAHKGSVELRQLIVDDEAGDRAGREPVAGNRNDDIARAFDDERRINRHCLRRNRHHEEDHLI